MKPDVVMQWCVYNDYPVFRNHIQKYRDRMGKIIIYPSRHHGFIDLESFSKEQVKETWVDPVKIDYGVEDWRQAETVPALQHVTSDWIWFREQDFFVDHWDKFYDDVERLMTQCDMFGWEHKSAFSYIHPCCLFIKRELLEKTKKDFRAHPEIDGSDHFAMITKDVRDLGAKIIRLQDVGYETWVNDFHMAGLTYPYQNWGFERVFGVGNIDAFFAYNYFSRLQSVEQHPKYLELSYELEDYMKRNKGMRDVIPETSPWRKFSA